MDCSGTDDEINNMLDEALDDSQVTVESGPTPPKVARYSILKCASFFFIFHS